MSAPHTPASKTPSGDSAAPAPGQPPGIPSSLHGSHDLLFPKLPYDMHDRAKKAVKDLQLQQFVNKATLLKDDHRKSLAPQVFGPRHNDIRQLAGNIKAHTLDHLDHYLKLFIERATANGSVVHIARDGAQANEIALEIARKEKLTLCVKSKSMVTEETLLLPALEGIGVKTIETDLGEFILQLDGDAPSHIVTPMIHKDRVAAAKAFQRQLGSRYTEDPSELSMIAREYLRDKYRQADLGISGGNFLVAETGSLVLCTNEGNGRFCTSAPRVHIAFVGIEKLVPSYRHLTVMLKLLARTATAQPLTCYTHIVTGPRRADEHDGPQQVHIILVDNGRSKILADPDYRDALRCIRCGACLNACPVYRKVGGHSYGAVYSGPIGAVITPLLRERQNYKDLPNASSLCGACFEACPVKIDIPRMLIKLRRDIVSAKLTGFMERLTFRLFAASLKRLWTYRLSNWFQRKALRMLAKKDGYVRKAPGPGAGWTAERDMPAPPAQSFRDWWKKNHS